MGKLKPPACKQGKRSRTPQVTPLSTQHMRPKFSLEYVQKSHCVSRCTQEEKAALLERLHELSQLTWQSIMQAGRHGQGCDTLPRNAISSIPSCIPEDTNILVFRFNGKAPMVGFRRHEVFLLCGWIEALHCINISAGWPALPDLPARRSDTRLVGGRPDRTRRRAGQEIEQPALKVRLAWDHDRRRRWRKLRAIGDHCKRRAGYRCTGGERYPDQPEYAHSELWHVEVPVDIDGRFWRVLFPSGVQQRGLCARHLSTLARRLH